MIVFETRLLKFGQNGEKTGWTYIYIDADLAHSLNPNVKKSYRVKGKIDSFVLERVALVPMGKGDFILAVNNEMRKSIRKNEGAMVRVQIAVDDSKFIMDQDFIDCLADDEQAYRFFKTFAPSHQHYFSKWISSAKTDETKAKRIAKAVNALTRGMNYAEMIREKEA